MGNTVLTKDEKILVLSMMNKAILQELLIIVMLILIIDVNTGEMKTESNGTIYDSNGKIEGHIIKKIKLFIRTFFMSLFFFFLNAALDCH